MPIKLRLPHTFLVFTIVIIAAEEIIKDLMFPNLDIGLSRIVTVIFCGLLALFVGRVIEKKINETEAKTIVAMERADQANKAKSEFLSSMSHELRTPLNAILGFGQMLCFNPKEPLSKDQKSSVECIMKGGQHLLELINDVLDLAKIEADKVNLLIKNVEVDTVLKECLSLVHASAKSRGIKIIVGEGFQSWAEIRADRMRFKQSLLNLMSNAVKYNRENGKITIDCHVTPNRKLHISVVDTGNGVPENMMKALFEPFNRLSAENTEVEGTGIGLSITKNLIERMDGIIGADSLVGKGSTFWIELPLVEINLVDAKIIDDVKTGERICSFPDIVGTVLYIEDNPANLLLMEKVVDRINGLDIISAHNGEQGVELAIKSCPDLIILDINLPGMGGFETLRVLQRTDTTMNIPVIALSAHAKPKDIEKGIKAGFRQYLTKPVKVEEIASSIKSILIDVN